MYILVLRTSQNIESHTKKKPKFGNFPPSASSDCTTLGNRKGNSMGKRPHFSFPLKKDEKERLGTDSRGLGKDVSSSTGESCY